MDSKNNKKKVIVVVSIALIILIALSATLFIAFGNGNKNNKQKNPNAENMTNSQITVSDYFKNYAGNDSIMENKLSTTNYTGSYALSNVVSVEFNEKLTDENIKTLIGNAGTNDVGGFKQYIYNRRKDKADTLNLFFEKADNNIFKNDYGKFTATSANGAYEMVTGYVYGDEDLAIIRFTDINEENFFMSNNKSPKSNSILYISLNYRTTKEATSASSAANTNAGIMYVFEDVYSSTTPNLKLFTVTYAYKLIITSPIIPDTALEF